MKMTILKGALIMLTFVGLFACKKGENDPFLSLRSRKARLAGEWVLTGLTNNSTSNGSFSNSSSYSSYSGEILTETSTATFSGTTVTSTNSGRYIHTLTFEKEGTYKIHTEMFYANGRKESVYDEGGNWVFVGKSKNQDLKNKEAIQLLSTTGTSVSYNNTPQNEVNNTYYSTGVSYYGEIMYLDRLTNKEMSVIAESTYTSTENGATYTSTDNINESFEAK